MDTFVSAVLGDLVSRSISFVLNRCFSQQQGVEEGLQRLHRMLLRIQTTVEEAEGRHITNQAMLLQLQMMRNGIYRGYYMLDHFRYHITQDKAQGEVGDRSSALSRCNPAKRFCSSTRTGKMASEGDEIKELQKMLSSLENITEDMKEFVVFLSCYPPMHRQPYCKYLLLENCMFGRHEEQERVINFLLQANFPGAEILPVLPIIGPTRVGKSTLVEHVCHDERVRRYFSSIVLFSGNDVDGGSMVPLRDCGVTKHQNLGSNGKSLVIIELVGDVDEETWRKISSNLRGDRMEPASKIIITSRSDKIATFGTTEALQLSFLPQEAYWYFFKTIAFGSPNPKEQPKLAPICMEIAAEMNGSFIAANVIGGLLRANLRAQFWYRLLKCLKDFANKHLLLFGKHPSDLVVEDKPVYPWRMSETRSALLAYSYYQACSAQNDLPRITLQDVHSGSVTPKGKFDVLVWRSNIPPYYSYLVRCAMQTPPPQMLAKTKRSQQRRRVSLM